MLISHNFREIKWGQKERISRKEKEHESSEKNQYKNNCEYN